MKKWIAIAMILCMLLPAASFAAGYSINHLETEELTFEKKKTVTAYVVDLTQLNSGACYDWSPSDKKMICDNRLKVTPKVLFGDIRDCYGIRIRYFEDVTEGDLGGVLHRPYVELNSGEWTWGDIDDSFNTFQGRDSYCSVLFKTPQAFGACSVEFAKAKSYLKASWEYNLFPEKLYFATEEAGFRYIESVAPGSTPYADHKLAGAYTYGKATIAPVTVNFEGTRTKLETYMVDLSGYDLDELGYWSQKTKKMQVSKRANVYYWMLEGQIDDCYGIEVKFYAEGGDGNVFSTPFRIYVQQLDSKWYAGDTDSAFAAIAGRDSTSDLFFKSPISMVAVSVEFTRQKTSGSASWTSTITPTKLYFRTEKAAKAYVDSLG